MFKKTLLALAAGGAIMMATLTGASETARADTSIHIGIGLPGVHFTHSSHRPRCWLPERHLCGGPIHGRPYYHGYPPFHAVPVYRGPIYYGGYWAPPPVYYGRYRRW